MLTRYTKILGMLLCCVSIGIIAKAQLVSGDAFLKGKYVEVGIAPNGAFGSQYAAPAGYHGRNNGAFGDPLTAVGFVSDPDKDGWGVGTPTYFGDYFMPGTPQEGWDVQINGTRILAWRGNGGSSVGFSAVGLAGTNTSFTTSGSKKNGIWEGAMGNLQIKQTTTLDTERLYFTVKVNLKNTGTLALNNIYYNRTVDPDNGVMLVPDYATINKIVRQSASSTDNSVLVSATAKTPLTRAYLGLGTKDCRAKAYIATTVYPNQNPANIYTGTLTAAAYKEAVGDSTVNDVAIGLVYNIGSLPAGDSTSFTYAYILKEADLDSALQQTKPMWESNENSYASGDTITACENSVIPVSILNGDGLNWGTWSTSVGLSATSGKNNNITVQNIPVTYRVIGTSGSCSNDTLFLTIKPILLPAAPTVTTPVNLCVGGTGTTLTAIGTNLKWYATCCSTSHIATPVITTAAASTNTYYVSQSLDSTAGGCEGSRAAITANVNALPAAPIVTTPVNLCVGGPGTTLTAIGTNLKWYATASATTSIATPVISTAAASTNTYYVSQELDATSGACEGARAAITANVNDLPAAPIVTTPFNLCVGGTGTTLTAIGTNLKWYATAIATTSIATPVISTASASSNTYYVSQSSDASSGSCEGARAAITANVNALPAAPIVTTPVNLCVGGTGTTLTAVGTNLKWYATASATTTIATPVITTASASTNTYYVSQSSDATTGACEGARAAITVNVNAAPAAPIVTTPVNLCVGGTGTTLTAIGTNLKWYATALSTTTIATPVISTTAASTNTYYVSQSLDATTGSCEGARAAITANVNALPAAPIVATPVNLCVGGPGTTLTAIGTNLKWYATASATTTIATPVITTAAASSNKYYVSQSLDASSGSCEGSRAELQVIVNSLPAAPIVKTPLQLCIGGPAVTLSASGTNLKWYADASTATSIATPVISTGSTGSNIYYVSQSLDAAAGSCEGSRAALKVIVNPLPIVDITPLGKLYFVFCNKQSITIKATAPTATSFQWSKESTSITGATDDTLVVSSIGNYSMLVKDINNCENKKTVWVSEDTLPKPTLRPINVQMCEGVDIMLYCNPGAAGYNYQWFQDAATMTAPLTTIKIPVNTTAQYRVRVTNIYGCIDTTNAADVATYPAIPTPVIIRMDPVLKLSASYAKYQWYRNGKAISGATKNSYTMLYDGEYSVEVWDNNECSKISEKVLVQKLGIANENLQKPAIKIYPNPTNGMVTIDADYSINVSVTDVSGRVIFSKDDVKNVNLSPFANGIYFFKIRDKNNNLISVEKISKTQ